MEPDKIFGNILRKQRALNKISQEKLSQESGLDRSYISLLERGLRQPTLRTIISLSRSLNTTASKMIHSVEEVLNENKQD